MLKQSIGFLDFYYDAFSVITYFLPEASFGLPVLSLQAHSFTWRCTIWCKWSIFHWTFQCMDNFISCILNRHFMLLLLGISISTRCSWLLVLTILWILGTIEDDTGICLWKNDICENMKILFKLSSLIDKFNFLKWSISKPNKNKKDKFATRKYLSTILWRKFNWSF